MSLAIFYGSTTGNTQMAAEKIHELLGLEKPSDRRAIQVSTFSGLSIKRTV